MERTKKNVEVEAQVIARGNVVPMMTEAESAETVQYVSDEDAAREDRLVSEIRMITEQTKQVVLFNSIEIGRRLTEAKAMVKRGTWGTWLKPDETNRYGCEEDRGYYPCRMVACFPLDVIAHGTVEKIVKQMNRANHRDDEEA